MDRSSLKERIISGTAIITALLMIIWGHQVSVGVKRAIMMCINVILPSLFAFTVISDFLMVTNIYSAFSAPFSGFTRKILRMPEGFLPVFMLSQTAGYPIGAALIGKMLKEGSIDRKTAENMLCFCIAPGPAFIMAVSSAICPEERFLWIKLFLSVFLANVLMLFITVPLRKIPNGSLKEQHISVSADKFIAAVYCGAETMIRICSTILFMSAIIEILNKLRITQLITMLFSNMSGAEPVFCYPYVRSLFDISNLTYVHGFPSAAAAMLSFGGICVLMQIKALCSDMSCLRAFLMRITCGLVSYLLCQLLTPHKVISEAVSVYISVDDEITVGNNQLLLSIFLLIMTIFIISQKNMVKREKI